MILYMKTRWALFGMTNRIPARLAFDVLYGPSDCNRDVLMIDVIQLLIALSYEGRDGGMYHFPAASDILLQQRERFI